MNGLVDILSQLAVIQGEIISPDTGVGCYAYANIPLSIVAANMPCFVNFPRVLKSNILQGSDERGREFWEVRDIGMTLFHSPYGAGITEEMAGLLVPYFELVYTTFGKYPHLKGVGEIVDALIIADSGVGTSNFVGASYNAISFTCQVTRRVRRLLDDID